MRGNRRLPWIVASVHGGLVVLTIVAILLGGEPDWPMAWIPFLFLDFPVSLLYAAVNFIGHGVPSHLHLVQGYSPLNDVWNFLAPATFFGLFGSAWWFILVRYVQHRRSPPGEGSFWSRNLL